MSLPFEFAAGSVAGKDHRHGVPRNRQDNYCLMHSAHLVTAVIADGCGSGGLATANPELLTCSGSSEVGSALAVRLLSTTLRRLMADQTNVTVELLRRAKRDLEAQLQVLAMAMGASLSEVVDRYFLFTLVGAILTDNQATFFGLGDGIVVVNNQAVNSPDLRADTQNRPVYLGYALTGSSLTDDDPSKLDLHILAQLPLGELQNFLIGTDGAEEIERRATSLLPGLDKPLGPLEQFWTTDRYFANGAALERQLNLAARDWHRTTDGVPRLEGGLLHDDTTIVVGRRSTSNC